MIEIPILDLDRPFSVIDTFIKNGGISQGKISFVTSYPYSMSMAAKYRFLDWEDANFKKSRVRVLANMNHLIKKGIKVRFINMEESKKMLEDLKIYQDYRLLMQ